MLGEHRAGFFIGDGAGVGKGRTIAGIIYENYKRGRKKHVWVSVSTDLVVDAGVTRGQAWGCWGKRAWVPRGFPCYRFTL